MTLTTDALRMIVGGVGLAIACFAFYTLVEGL
jgi:hypothetical protein